MAEYKQWGKLESRLKEQEPVVPPPRGDVEARAANILVRAGELNDLIASYKASETALRSMTNHCINALRDRDFFRVQAEERGRELRGFALKIRQLEAASKLKSKKPTTPTRRKGKMGARSSTRG